MDSALERLEDGEICRIVVDGEQLEAAWWPQVNGWVYHTRTATRAIAHDDVEEWMPAWTQF